MNQLRAEIMSPDLSSLLHCEWLIDALYCNISSNHPCFAQKIASRACQNVSKAWTNYHPFGSKLFPRPWDDVWLSNFVTELSLYRVGGQVHMYARENLPLPLHIRTQFNLTKLSIFSLSR